MLNKVVLPYTIWYTEFEKILRLNLDKGIDTVTNISTKATLNGTAVNDLVSAIFNPKTKSIDITIRSDSRMDVDGEMQISLSYSDAKTHESILVVSVRSHEKIATENPKEVKQTKLTVRNGISYTIGAADEQVVYSCDLVDSYYVGGQSDSNFIKVLYNNTVPEKDVKDLRPQPGSWTIGNNQSWPKI